MDNRGGPGQGDPNRQRQDQNHHPQQGNGNGRFQQAQSTGLSGASPIGRSQQLLNATLPALPGNSAGAGQGYGSQGLAFGSLPYATGTGLIGNAQPLTLASTMPNGNLPLSYMSNYMNTGLPSMDTPFATQPPYLSAADQSYLPCLMNNYLGGQHIPGGAYPMQLGTPGNRPAGLGQMTPGQVSRASGSLQPRGSGASYAAPNTSVNMQQPPRQPLPQRRPTGAQRNGQPSAENQPANHVQFGQEPANRGAGGRAGGQGPVGQGQAAMGAQGAQPVSGNSVAAIPSNPAPMSISQRLDRGDITNVKGLTREQVDELLVWAHNKKMQWKVVHKKYKFKVKESTIRGWHRKKVKGPIPRKPVFTERDNELLLEAVEHFAGGHLDNVNKCKIQRLWANVKAYIEENGGQTTAGGTTLKKKYISLTEDMPEIRKDLKPSKTNWDNEAYEGYKVQGHGDAADEDDEENDKPARKSTAKKGGASTEQQNESQFDSEHDQYELEHEEPLEDFGFPGTDDEEMPDGDDEKDEDWNPAA